MPHAQAIKPKTAPDGPNARRTRMSVRVASRDSIIEGAKGQIEAWHEKLLELDPPVAETLEMCSLAFLHEAITGDGVRSQKQASSAFVPLYEAIRRAMGDEAGEVDDGAVPPATPAQIAEVSRWLSDRIFSDAW